MLREYGAMSFRLRGSGKVPLRKAKRGERSIPGSEICTGKSFKVTGKINATGKRERGGDVEQDGGEALGKGR